MKRLRFKVLAKVAGEDVLVTDLDEVTAGKLLWQYKLLGISANKYSYIEVQP